MQNSPARSSIDVGSVIADTYTIEALIGRGGMGAVFLASHKRLPGKQVAIKVLHAEMSGEEVLARFRREAEIASRLGHPNIVQVHDFNLMPDGTPYLVLEYLRGESLAQRLQNGPLPHDQLTSIVRQIGSALAAAHREGIVHRDLKPQNIFIVPTEVDGRVVEIAKVLDFGISKIRGSTTVKTQDSSLLGTPQYMAPEQATGQHKLVDERTDVFALGAIVYEMLMGHPAFSGETIPEVVFKVVYEQPAPLTNQSETVTAAVHRAMAKAQEDRFPNVNAFVEALTGAPLPVGRPGPSIPPPDIGFAAGSRAPNTGKDAFAQTMGSGDHGSAATQLPPSQAPVAPQQTPVAQSPVAPPQSAKADVRGSAPTLHSQNQALVNAGTVSAGPPPGAKRKGPLIAIIALGVVVIAGVGIFMTTRGTRAKISVQATYEREPTPPAPPPVEAAKPPVEAEKPAVENPPIEAANPPIEAAKPPVEAAKPPVEAAKPPIEAAKPPVEAKKPPKQETKPQPGPVADDETTDDGDETVTKQLHEAEAALAASKWDRAESLANTVSSSETSNIRQKQRAALVFGIVQCLARNDEGRARIALRKLIGAPKMRRKLLDACHANNYLQNVR